MNNWFTFINKKHYLHVLNTMKNTILTFFSILILGTSFAQNEYLIFLTDKPTVSEQVLEKSISERAKLHRKIQGIKYDIYDMPVSAEYLTQLSVLGLVKNKSKWLNAVHFVSNLTEKEIKNQFTFIKDILKLNFSALPKTETKKYAEISISAVADSIDYGLSFNQLEITETASCLHENGLKGDNVLIAVLDAGFPKLDTMLAFKKMRQEGRIIDHWDFEDNASYVYHKSTHGTYVSSIIGGVLDSLFVGSAPKADYAFYITEIAAVEINLEEFNLVLGLERADSIGADICSISLGYRNFDTLQLSYGYAGMNGTTTVVAQGVTVARKKGLIISVAAGNSGGNGAGSLGSPCDADSILCVGAINYDSTIAGFSSQGPTFDGRIKPDAVTIGRHCFFVRLDDSVRNGNGTSFATPLMSGMVACIKQAHPLRNNYQIVDAIKNSGHTSTSPDNIFGWGIPNACAIDSALTVLDSIALSINEVKSKLKIILFPNPVVNELTIKSEEIITSFQVFSLDGKILLNQKNSSNQFEYKLDFSELRKGVYFVRINGVGGRFVTRKVVLTF